MSRLTANDADERERACHIARFWRTPALVPALRALLRDPSVDSSDIAADVLDDANETLAFTLYRYRVREAAQHALAAMGEPFAPAPTEMLVGQPRDASPDTTPNDEVLP